MELAKACVCATLAAGDDREMDSTELMERGSGLVEHTVRVMRSRGLAEVDGDGAYRLTPAGAQRAGPETK